MTINNDITAQKYKIISERNNITILSHIRPFYHKKKINDFKEQKISNGNSCTEHKWSSEQDMRYNLGINTHGHLEIRYSTNQSKK